ncbi:hypothetical protein LTR40_014905, partial [Exophiala xenobiotica]
LRQTMVSRTHLRAPRPFHLPRTRLHHRHSDLATRRPPPATRTHHILHPVQQPTRFRPRDVSPYHTRTTAPDLSDVRRLLDPVRPRRRLRRPEDPVRRKTRPPPESARGQTRRRQLRRRQRLHHHHPRLQLHPAPERLVHGHQATQHGYPEPRRRARSRDRPGRRARRVHPLLRHGRGHRQPVQ